MAAQHVERFTVSSADELDDLEACLADGHLEAVQVEIPDGSDALLTAREFRRILLAARASGVTLEFATEDPLRRELARITGARLSILPQAPPLRADAATRRIERQVGHGHDVVTHATAPDTEVAPPSRFQPFQTSVTTGRATDPFHDVDQPGSEPSFSFVITPPVPRRPDLNRTQPTARSIDGTADLHEVWDGYRSPQPASSQAMRRRRAAPWRALAVMLVLALLASGGLAGAVYAVPSATVTLTPAIRDVTAEVTYGVALPGQSWDIMIAPTELSEQLTFRAEVPTTGERSEPDAAASGTILLTNPTTNAVTIPAGSLLTSTAGLTYATVDDVVVPAADPFGTLTLGSASIAVTATVPGPEGNAPAEALYGQLDNGIFYVNREALDGGTVRYIATVAEADLEALRERATVDLGAQAGSALAARLAVGQQIVSGTEERGPIDLRFSHEVGSDAEVVRVDATQRVAALVFSLNDVHAEARDAVVARLNERAGPNASVRPESIHTSTPQPVAGSNGTAFSITAGAQAHVAIAGADIAALTRDLPGMPRDAALARIRQVPGVAGVSIRHGPSWLELFEERMPRRQARITIEVVDATGIPAQAEAPRSQTPGSRSR
jgi:hypothetical protein